MIDYEEDWLIKLLFRYRGSVAIRACIFAVPCAAVSALLVQLDDWSPDFRNKWGLLELGKSQLWTATTAVLAMLLAFRTNRAMARFWEGTGLLHQMRGEWFDSISCCVTFSYGALGSKRQEVKRFRHTIVRLMSLCHGSALEEIGGNDKEKVETIDCLGLDNTTLCYLKSCKEELKFNRVEVLLHLTQLIITKALDDGVLKIPPPILSRVYQTLSRGFVNLLNAKKIADTRFPFPYAQLIAMLLFAHVLLTPIMITCLIPNKFWAPIFTFVPIFGMFSVNFIGVELENPFGSDENDLPLGHFQSEMNKCLLMLLHEGSDIIANVNESRCKMRYRDLAASMDVHDENSRLTRLRPSFNRPSLTDMAEVTDIYEDGRYSKWSKQSSTDTFRSSSNSNTGAGSNFDLCPSWSTSGGTLSSQKTLSKGKSGPLQTLQEEGDVSESLEVAGKQALEFRRTANDLIKDADIDVGAATTMMHMDFDKTCGSCATALLAQPRASSDDCNVDHVVETKSVRAPFSPVQEASIESTMDSHQSGPVLQSVKCHPSRCRVRTPRQDMVSVEQK